MDMERENEVTREEIKESLLKLSGELQDFRQITGRTMGTIQRRLTDLEANHAEFAPFIAEVLHKLKNQEEATIATRKTMSALDAWLKMAGHVS